MDGQRALHYARGRFGLTDYQRMDRQRCMISAMVSAADPLTLLTKYQEIAATAQDIVTTDIPVSVLGDFADLALKVKDAGIQSVVFDDSVIRPAYPDFDKVQTVVQDALAGPPVASTAPQTPPPAPGPGSTTLDNEVPTSGTSDASAASPSPVTAAADACAYDPVAAQEALDEGQPPTKRRR
jgi:hypothetical protein